MNHTVENNRSFADVIADTRDELKDFVETRITLLRAEMREKVKMLKMAAPLAIIGVVLLSTAYLLFTLALVGVVLALVPANPFRWAIAFAAVGVLWTLLGGVAAYFAKREFESRELMPKRTIGVLKQDKLWFQSEVKTQI